MTLYALVLPSHVADVLPLVLLYIGPDVFLPLTSALAAIGGVLLMFWHRIAAFVGRLLGRRESPKPPETPAKRD